MPGFKLMYLARRNPNISEADFPEAWRSHSRLASTFGDSLGTHFLTVRQCVKAYDLDAPAAYRNAYDGCALLQMKSWQDLETARSHPRALMELKQDEERVFADYVDQWTMAAEEIPLSGDPDGEHVLLLFMTPASGHDMASFTAGLERLGQELVVSPAAGKARGIMIDRVVEPAAAYGFGAVVEIWFDLAETMIAVARDAQLSGILDAPELADSGSSPRLLARLNLSKHKADAEDGGSAWTEETGAEA